MNVSMIVQNLNSVKDLEANHHGCFDGKSSSAKLQELIDVWSKQFSNHIVELRLLTKLEQLCEARLIRVGPLDTFKNRNLRLDLWFFNRGTFLYSFIHTTLTALMSCFWPL